MICACPHAAGFFALRTRLYQQHLEELVDRKTEYEAATEFVTSLPADPNIPLPPALVIEVGFIKNRGWAVIEANTAWGAGIYGCDPAPILAALRRVCVPTSNLTPSELAWTIP